MISAELFKVMVVGGRKNADFCEYRNKNGELLTNEIISICTKNIDYYIV